MHLCLYPELMTPTALPLVGHWSTKKALRKKQRLMENNYSVLMSFLRNNVFVFMHEYQSAKRFIKTKITRIENWWQEKTGVELQIICIEQRSAKYGPQPVFVQTAS